MTDCATSDTYLHALACFYCKRNRLYRIFIRPDELIFIWAGAGSEGVAGAKAAATFGRAYSTAGAGIEVLAADALGSALDPTEKNRARLENHLRDADLLR